MSNKRKIFRIVVITVLGVIITGLAFLPVMLKKYVVKNSKELLGRQVEMKSLGFNYFTSTLKVIDFKMLEADEKETFISFDTLIVNAEPYKYISKIISLDQLYLRGLQVNLEKNDTVFNFNDLIEYHSKKDTLKPGDTREEVFKYQLSELELKDAVLNFKDNDVNETTTLEDLAFYVPYIEWDQEADSEADIELNFSEGGTLRAAFSYHPQTGDFEGQVNLEALQLRPFYKYAARLANINDLKGAINSILDLKGNDKDPENSLVSGTVEIIGLELTDKADNMFLGGGKIACDLEEINFHKGAYRIAALNIDRPYLQFQLDSASNNLFRIFNISGETSETKSDSAMTGAGNKEEKKATEEAHVAADSVNKGPQIYYALKKFKINNGVLDYTDNLTGQPFDYHLSEIMIDTDSIFSDSKWVDLFSEMVLNEKGTLKAKLGFNPQRPMDLDIDIAIKDFVLSDLNIYSQHYTGHSVLQGDMFYFSDSKIEAGQITSENSLMIKDVSVENSKGGLWSLPLKLAVFLLKDKNGDIELDVPLRGDLNDPEVDVWALVGATLKKKILGVTDNPAKNLAKLVDASPEDLEALLLNYPDTSLTDAHKRQLDLILELEEKKEGISIVFNYVFDKDLMRDSLFNTIDTTTVAGYTSDSLSGYRADHESKLKEVAGDSLVLSSMVNDYQDYRHIDTLLLDYGKVLSNKIAAYISERRPDSGIEVNKAEVSDPANVGATPRFKVKFGVGVSGKEEAQSSKSGSTLEENASDQ